MTTSTVAPAPKAAGELTHKQIMSILSGLMIGMFLAALDQTIVATAIRTIGDDLNGLSIQAWVTTAFLITSTIATPLFGKLSDIYGRKPFFMAAITIFIVGSALCGTAHSMYELAAYRALQGIGAGGIMPLALAIIGDIIPPRERAKYQGYFMAVFATASVLGPVVGGFLAGQSSVLGVPGWRWIFYINVPLGIIALFVVTRVLKLDHTRRAAQIDWAGAGALVVCLVPLLIIAEQGREWGWASGSAFVCYALGLIGLVGFVLIERAAGDNALLPLRLFRIRNFSAGSAQSLIVGMGMFGGMSCIPLYLQIVKGASPTKSGLLILPMVAGIMVASMTAGQITARTGRYRIFPIVGSAAMIAGLLVMTQIGADTALWQTDLYMALFGVGLGLNMQSVVLAMQNAVDPRDMGVSTSSATFFRQVGGSLGTAVFLSILFSRAGTEIKGAFTSAQQTPAFQQAAQAHPDQLKLISGGSGSLNDTSFLTGLDSALAHPFLVGFSNAMDTVFLVGGLVLILGLVLSLVLREVPLRAMSGMAAMADEAAAAVGVEPTGQARPVPVEAVAAAHGVTVHGGAGRGAHEAVGQHEAAPEAEPAAVHHGEPRHLDPAEARD